MSPSIPRQVVMLTSSYPRFPGDAIATFMEPIARGLAGLGHQVHVVAPWHSRWRRPLEGDGEGLHVHLFRYAPLPALNVFGYAAALRADVRLRASAWIATPLAIAAGWRLTRRVIREVDADLLHAHWVVPSGVMGALATRGRPLVISLHGSDVYVAERHPAVGRAARMALRRAAWVTACSDDLAHRAVALGADPARMTVAPYGVDADRFRPDAGLRAAGRARLGLPEDRPLVFAFGRLVRKKGLEHLVTAVPVLRQHWPTLCVAIAGDGDLRPALERQAAAAGAADTVRFLGMVPQVDIPMYLAASDVAVAPSIRDEAGNVDGLPNAVMEALASGTPLVATRAGGIGAVATDGESARLVPEQDADALAAAIGDLLRNPERRATIGRQARALVCREYSWARLASTFDDIYARVLQGGPGR